MPILYKIKANEKYACYTFMSVLVAMSAFDFVKKKNYAAYNLKKVVRCCETMPKLSVMPNCIPKDPRLGRRRSHHSR